MKRRTIIYRSYYSLLRQKIGIMRLIVFLLFISTLQSFAADIGISGTVKDQSGKPLPGVTELLLSKKHQPGPHLLIRPVIIQFRYQIVGRYYSFHLLDMKRKKFLSVRKL
jgi:hypothetical protein